MISAQHGIVHPGPQWAAIAVAAVVIVVLGGCSASTEDRRPPGTGAVPETASEEQIAALADGEVTEEEYTAGYRRFVACITDAGYEIMEMGRPSTLYEAGLPVETVASGIDEICYEAEWRGIDSIWQHENPPWTEVGERLVVCLEKAGLSMEGNEEDLKERMLENDLDIQECMGT